MSQPQWEPDQGALELVKGLLRDSSSNDNAVQQGVVQKLGAFLREKEFPKYLSFIFNRSDDISIRAVSGFLLKNVVKSEIERIDRETLDYIYACVFNTLASPDPTARAVAGTIITTVLTYGFFYWPSAIPDLLNYIDDNNQYAAEGAFSALCKVCEDSVVRLESYDSDLAGRVLLKIMSFFNNPVPKIRAASVLVVKHFISANCKCFQENIDTIVNSIYNLSKDTSIEVIKAVCDAFFLMMDVAPYMLSDNIDFVLEFLCTCLDSSDEDLALSACEFWLSLAQREELYTHVEKFLPKLVPLLVKNMVYTADRIMSYEADAQNDREEVAKPRNQKAKLHGTQSSAKHNVVSINADEDEIDEDDDEDDDDFASEWDIRKCASGTLDLLATIYESELLKNLMPYLTQELYHPDWIHKECGILIVGAIADGCMSAMTNELPYLFGYLMESLHSDKALIRSITCWTLSKYALWTYDPNACAQQKFLESYEQLSMHKMTYFNSFLYAILASMEDPKPKVQEYACGAFMTICDLGEDCIKEHVDRVICMFEKTFISYRPRDMVFLYDAVGAFSGAIGDSLNNPVRVSTIMKLLYSKWQEMDDVDDNHIALLECMSSVVNAAGESFLPFFNDVWARCLSIMRKSVELIQNSEEGKPEPLNEDLVIVAMNLIGSICRSLKSASLEILKNAQDLFGYYSYIMSQHSQDIRQCAFSFIGDIYPTLCQSGDMFLEPVVQNVIKQIEECCASQPLATSNAIWAIGEICLEKERTIAPWIDNLVPKMHGILLAQADDRSLKQNAVVAIGRMALNSPEAVSKYFSSFIQPWCHNFQLVTHPYEKKTSFEGICKAIRFSPAQILNNLKDFCYIAVSWENIPASTKENVREILLGFKSGHYGNWESLTASWPRETKQLLADKYQI